MSRYALLLIAVSFTASSAPIPPEAIVQGVRVQDVSAFTTQVNREVTAFLAKHVPANAH